MPAPRPNLRKTQGLHNLGRGGEREAHYVSHCKLCRLGIYKTQPRRFSTGRVLGLCHDACIEQAPEAS